MSKHTITKPMLRELRSIERTHEPSDPYEWLHAPGELWFYARDKVLGALLSRGLVTNESTWELTEAGRKVLHHVAR